MITTIVRAHVAHARLNPFVSEDALETLYPDASVVVAAERVV